jgi:murein DD-endopeptidase MepM/ murein hydrolase activator NlpD
VPYRPPPKEPERYRGRRRAPTPPRSRYAAVVTTAFLGAGVAALATGAAMPDAKTTPQALSADSAELQDRATAADRASRDTERGLGTSITAAPDFWQLPLHGYQFTSPFGQRWGRLHAGVDLALPEGTPYHAAKAGVVILARWHGGYGNAVIIDHGNGIQTVYGHASKLLVKEGQRVEAGQVLGLIGNTGYSFGAHLHFEIHINDQPTDPVAYLRRHGVDIPRGVEAIYGGVVTG